MNTSSRNQLAMEFAAIASEAGRSIMAAYGGTLSIDTKRDGSPVSEADRGAERIIAARLARLLPDVPMLAEESFDPTRQPKLPERFLLIDPLDGTREFISKNGEFTVNIALVEAGDPVVGCVYAPALNDVYLAGDGAFRGKLEPGESVAALQNLRTLSTAVYPANGLRAVVSRSHLDSDTEAFLAKLNIISRKSVGSSLKFCLIARGDADLYPRLAPTMEWDTAAGQAILTAAGGCVMSGAGRRLHYGKSNLGFRNDRFVAWASEPLLPI